MEKVFNAWQKARVAVALFFLWSAAGAAQSGTPANISGRWEVSGVTSGPWLFDLTVNGGVVTGQVRARGALPVLRPSSMES